VSKQVDPPGADRIEVASPLDVIQPSAGTARDRERRGRFVVLHLCARVPHALQAALNQGVSTIVRHGEARFQRDWVAPEAALVYCSSKIRFL